MGRQAFDEMSGRRTERRPSGLPTINSSAGSTRRRPRNSTPAAARRSFSSAASASPSRSMATTKSTERLIPFDIIPRVLTDAGMGGARTRPGAARQRAQRLPRATSTARRECIKAGIVPADLVFRNPHYRPEMIGLRGRRTASTSTSPASTSCASTRTTFYVLEDNARTPSGVSYMLENREVMMRLFPELFAEHRVAPVENYPDELLATLRSVAPRSREPRSDRRCC